jgi:hypothetical protein
MPGNSTYVIDAAQTFSTVILMGCVPRTKFQSDEVDTTADGTPKWTAGLAVTYHAVNGMPAQSDVINVTIAAAANPADGISPGSPVTLDGLRVGISPVEKRGDRIVGGKPWHSATAVRTLGFRQSKDAAA